VLGLDMTFVLGPTKEPETHRHQLFLFYLQVS